ncbi:MAG: SSU ribosomal protein S20p, partial [uncultured Corynebacteriales bacterium]
GEHQVPAQAHQDQREGAPSQQVGQVVAEDGRAPLPRGRRRWRPRPDAGGPAARFPAAGQGREQGRHPRQPGGEQEVGDGAARQLPL